MPRLFFLEDLLHLPCLSCRSLGTSRSQHTGRPEADRARALGNAHGGGQATRAGRPCSLRELPANARCRHLRIKKDWWRRFSRISTKFSFPCGGQAPRDGLHLTKPGRLPSCLSRTAEPRRVHELTITYTLDCL